MRVPIRERFEIHVTPTTWGHWPFLAVPDRKNGLAPRDEGRWSAFGSRQAEAVQGTARAYYLWAWKNPRPDEAIESLTIEPGDRRFLVAAVTLGHLDEPPFALGPKQEVRIVLPEAEDAARPFGLEVEVDRGVATFPYALPAEGAAQFLDDERRGWGEAQNDRSSPAYVEIAAIPSATVTVRSAGEELGAGQLGRAGGAGHVRRRRARAWRWWTAAATGST